VTSWEWFAVGSYTAIINKK